MTKKGNDVSTAPKMLLEGTSSERCPTIPLYERAPSVTHKIFHNTIGKTLIFGFAIADFLLPREILSRWGSVLFFLRR
jgi:hypothetical protein